MRKLTNTQQRMLLDVHRGRVRRTATGWTIGATDATAADRRTLTSLENRELITADPGPHPLEPGEAVPAQLTETGRAGLSQS